KRCHARATLQGQTTENDSRPGRTGGGKGWLAAGRPGATSRLAKYTGASTRCREQSRYCNARTGKSRARSEQSRDRLSGTCATSRNRPSTLRKCDPPNQRDRFDKGCKGQCRKRNRAFASATCPSESESDEGDCLGFAGRPGSSARICLRRCCARSLN